MADNYADDLDKLLDSALDDFQNLNVSSTIQSSGAGTENKEDYPPPLPSGVQGLGMGLPDLRSKKKGKQKVSKDAHVSEALDKLKQQTVEAVKGIESVSNDAGDNDIVDEWLKQFEGQDMNAIMEDMMQQLLSKEVLHEPMKEIGDKYPKWLEEHKSSLSKEEFERYSQQYEIIQNLNEVYEKDPGNYPKIFEILQKVQECGHPPSDIVQELAPGLDLNSLGQLSPEMQPNCSQM
ncbi:hypothetical protein K1719_017881 [Acacia pycnantha]|nr:hypothetical protein K1719_017881 [Acacia pycnantha]